MTSGGGYEWFDVYANALWDADSGSRIGYLGKLTNINERKSEVNRWREQANTDPLTGLSNRKRIEEQIAQALEDDKENGAAFLFIDVDNFKAVNDRCGHQAGDHVLVTVAGLLREICPEALTARLGGDEFVLYLRDHPLDFLIRKAGQLVELMRETFGNSEMLRDLSPSIGIVRSEEPGLTLDELIRRADAAMYTAKRGRLGYCVYEPGLENPPDDDRGADRPYRSGR